MKSLQNDCSCTDVWVSPKNWKTITGKKAMEANWYVQCVFTDPVFKEKYPKGFQFRKKLNKMNTVDKRKAAAEFYLKEIPILFEHKGFNPITKKYMIEPVVKLPSFNISPDSSFLDALEYAYKKLDVAGTTNNDVRLILKHFKVAAKTLEYDSLKIKEIQRKHIRFVIDELEETDGKFSGHKFNKYRSYLQILYSELLELEVVDSNIIDGIRKRAQIKTIREVLTVKERGIINLHLKEHFPQFWLFMVIFFHSGGRITELMSVKVGDVDLETQKYKVLIKKGKQYTWAQRVIKDNAVSYWRKAIFGGKKTDFVFSVGLVPGDSQIRTEQISRRWRQHVKEKLGITADFYSLKHSNLDETVNQLSMQDAQRMGNFTSTKMLENNYAVGEKDRQIERLKKVDNEF